MSLMLTLAGAYSLITGDSFFGIHYSGYLKVFVTFSALFCLIIAVVSYDGTNYLCDSDGFPSESRWGTTVSAIDWIRAATILSIPLIVWFTYSPPAYYYLNMIVAAEYFAIGAYAAAVTFKRKKRSKKS